MHRELMDKNAELIITRHRALHARPGELENFVKLPMKRKAMKQLNEQEAILNVRVDKISDIVCLLHKATTGKILLPSMQSKL